MSILLDKESLLARLRRVEERMLAEFTGEELSGLGPELLEISDTIKKVEVGALWWVVGPGGKIFRCEKTDAAAEN